MKNFFQKQFTNIKDICKQNKICIAILAVQIISFYYILSNMGFGTHDELLQYMHYSNPDWKFNTDFSGRFMPVIGQILMYLQFNAPSFAIYRAFTMIAILLGVGAASLFVKHHISEKDWLKYAIVFFAFLQIAGVHNGAVAFDMTYQYRMFYCFVFLDLYLLFFKTEKKLHYILGSFFWCVAINSYEAYYVFCIVLFFMAVVTLYEKKQLSIKNLFRYLWLPAVISIISVAIYFVKMSGQAYDGASVSSSYGILHKIKSIIIYTFGSWPLRLNAFTFKQIVSKVFTSDLSSLFVILKSLLVAGAICIGARNEKLRSNRLWVVACILSMMSAGLVALLVGVTEQYCSWAFEYGQIAGGISYYSYFFIIMVFFLLMSLTTRIKNKRYSKIIKILIFVCVFSTCVVTDINNMETAANLDKEDNKYELFEAVVQSEYFSTVEDGAVIYAPEMIGVHYDMGFLDMYCKRNYGKEVKFCNQLTEVQGNEIVYMLRYLPNSSMMMFGHVDTTTLETNEIMVLGLKGLSKYSMCVWRDVDEQMSDVLINEKKIGVYGNSVSIPLEGMADGNVMVVHAENIPMEDVAFLEGNITDSSVLRFEFGEGVHEKEHFGRWIATDSYYIVDYKGYETVSSKISLMLSTASEETGFVEIETNGTVSKYEVSGESTVIEIDVLLQHGENRIHISSKVPSMDTRDARDINLKLTEAYGIFEEGTYKFY